jgi:SynChlorMet cassette protein ScmC
MIKEFRDDKIIYKLSLSDGTTWGFSATHEIFPWLKKLAEIMCLELADLDKIDRRLLFLAHKPENLPNHDQINNEDWNVLKRGTAYRIWSHSKVPETIIELNHEFIDHKELQVINMWSSLKQIYLHYIENNGAPFHATLAEIRGKGVLIAASGGTGKSTCYNRLPKYWNPLADDNALAVRIEDNNYRVHPMPTWSDHLWNSKKSTFDSSYSVPLKGMFFLEQSEKDEVISLSRSDALREVYESMKQIWETYWEKTSKKEKQNMSRKLFDTAFNIVKQVPCYKLKATLHGKFWKEIENVLEE